jgi:hypothetical protein
MATLTTNNVVRVAEDVEDRIYNFRPSDTPLVSSISRTKVTSKFHEWTADTYRAPNPANAAIEGADATFPTPGQPGQYNNRTQIIQDSMKISGSTEAVKKHGRASEVSYQKTKKMVELKKDIEAAAIGNATAVTDNGTSTAGQMRGLYGWVATNNSLGAGGVAPNPQTNTAPTAGTLRALTEQLVKDVILAVYTNGGDADVLLVSPAHKQKVSSFTGNVQRTNEVADGQRSENVRLNTAFTFYGHDFGVTKCVPNRVMSGAGAGLINTAYVVDYDKISLGQLRPFQTTELARTGDAEAWQILTEVTLIVRQESTLGAIRDLTATG